MARELKYRIRADDRTAGGLRSAETRLRGFAGRARGIMSRMGGLLPALGIAAAVRGMIGAIRSTIQAAGVQEAVETELAAAFRKAGADAQAGSAKIAALARQIQLLTNIGDEATLSAAAYGMNLGVLPKDIDKVTVAAVGLSKIIKADLNTAMMLLARASKGQTELFTRYGIQLDKTKSAQEQFNEVMKLSREGFQLARADGDTLQQDLEQLGNAWGDLSQASGQAILAMVGGTDNIDAVTQSILSLADAVERAQKGFGLLGRIGKAAMMLNPATMLMGQASAILNTPRMQKRQAKAAGAREMAAQAAIDAADGEVTATAAGAESSATKAARRASVSLAQFFDIARGQDVGPNARNPELAEAQRTNVLLSEIKEKL